MDSKIQGNTMSHYQTVKFSVVVNSLGQGIILAGQAKNERRLHGICQLMRSMKRSLSSSALSKMIPAYFSTALKNNNKRTRSLLVLPVS